MKKRPYFSSLLLVAAILFAAEAFDSRPPENIVFDSREVGLLMPIDLSTGREGWAVQGAWIMPQDDTRLHGLSGLSFSDGRLDAINDFGWMASFPPPAPSQSALDYHIFKLAGSGGRTLFPRDTEALVRHEDKLWVAREGDHALIRQDAAGKRLEATLPLPVDWPENGGAEAILAPREGQPMLLLSERRPQGLAFDGEAFRTFDVVGAKGWITDATHLPGGEILVLSRTIGPLGFSSWIARGRWDGEQLALGAAAELPLSFRDNAEGIAAAPLPGGATRLWIVTDDNFNRYMRTLLVAIDIEAGALPAMPY